MIANTIYPSIVDQNTMAMGIYIAKSQLKNIFACYMDLILRLNFFVFSFVEYKAIRSTNNRPLTASMYPKCSLESSLQPSQIISKQVIQPRTSKIPQSWQNVRRGMMTYLIIHNIIFYSHPMKPVNFYIRKMIIGPNICLIQGKAEAVRPTIDKNHIRLTKESIPQTF